VDVVAALRALGSRGLHRVLVEGGAAVHRAMLDAGAVDRMELYVNGRVLAGGNAVVDLARLNPSSRNAQAAPPNVAEAAARGVPYSRLVEEQVR
jgi:riboflavin biosynthesis pyrimidine reductase